MPLFDLDEFTGKNPRVKAGCYECPIKGNIRAKKVPPEGGGKQGIAIIVDYPRGCKSDILNDSGFRKLVNAFEKVGLDFEEDCKVFSLVKCGVYKRNQIDQQVIKCCSYYLEKELKEFNPSLIISCGEAVTNWLLTDHSKKLSELKSFGRLIPSKVWKCPIGCIFSLNRFKDAGKQDKGIPEKYLDTVIHKFISKYKSIDVETSALDRDAFCIVEDDEQYREMVLMVQSGKPINFDIETNGLSPYEEDSKILTAAFACDEDYGYCLPLDHPDYENGWKNKAWLATWLKSDYPKQIQNWAFEEKWAREILNTRINNVILDPMILQHLVDNREGICSQDFQIYTRFGDSYKDMVDQSDLENEELEKVAQYNVLDVRYMSKWIKELKAEAKKFPGILETSYPLFHKTIPNFISMTINGMKIDDKILVDIEDDTKKQIDKYNEILTASLFVKNFNKKFKKKYNYKSPKQNQEMFFDIMGLESSYLTESGFKKKKKDSSFEPTLYHKKTDKTTLMEIQDKLDKSTSEYSFIEAFLNVQKYEKLLSTYIKGLRKCIINGRIHPAFLLHTASSFRSSSIAPNFQNIPAHDKITSRIRECYVPDNDYIMSVDYKSNEVKYLAALSDDKNLIEDVNKGIDFHKHFVAMILDKKVEDITPEERFQGKNGFVFPIFYGSTPEVVAKKQDWNYRKVRATVKAFWERYNGVASTNKQMLENYENKMFIDTPLGFYYIWSRAGVLSLENIYNLRVQGTAFHRLLQAINDMMEEFENNEYYKDFKSKLIGQIHDCMVFDIDKDEMLDMVKLCNKHMCSLDVWGEWDGKVQKSVEFEIATDFTEGEEFTYEELVKKLENGESILEI